MWNDDPSPTGSHSLPRHRAKREREKRKENIDGKDESLKDLMAFGYECFLFQNDDIVAAIEAGRYLIPWQDQDPSREDTLWLDRYDARNLLDDQRYFTGPRQVYDNTLLGAETGLDLDLERYGDLDSDEEILFGMDEYEREEHLEEKRSAAYRLDRRGFGFNYGEDTNDAPSFKLHFSVPEGMATPEDAKSLALIERTAKFINNCSEPTMEATLQVKQAGNPSFGFLTRRHPLHAFYKHVRWLMQTGVYEYEEDVRKRKEEEGKNEMAEKNDDKAILDTEEAAAPSGKATTATDEHGPPHQDVQQIVDTTAKYVARYGPEFEDRIRMEEDTRFSFLDNEHPWYTYYCGKKDEYKQLSDVEQPKKLTESDQDNKTEQEKPGVHTREENTHESRFDPSALFINYLEQEESASQSSLRQDDVENTARPEISSLNPNTPPADRVLEMKRLERMQRIRELLKKKQESLFPEPPEV